MHQTNKSSGADVPAPDAAFGDFIKQAITPLGSKENWPAALRILFDALIQSPAPALICWGTELVQVYNEAFSRLAAGRHPAAFGAPAREIWGDIWPQISPLINSVIEDGKPVDAQEQSYIFNCGGEKETISLAFSLSPLLDEAGKVNGLLVFAHKPSDQRVQDLLERNIDLKESEERYHKMIEEVQDYAIILLDTNGAIRNWNIGAQKIKGYSNDEILGKNFRIFYTPEDRQRKLPESLLEEASRNGRALHEGWRVRKDGSVFWGSIVISALHGEDGSIIGFSKVTRDLTERKHAEDRMKKYLHELEEQNKELEQFAYIASHDLQEPLRKIQTFTGVLEMHLHDEVLARQYFEKIKSSAQRMSDLIKSVLNYSRLSSDKPPLTDTDLNQVLESVKVDFEVLIRDKKARVESEPLPVIRGIAPQLSQLFFNIVGNSIKFNENEPVIHVSARMVAGDEITHHPELALPGKYWEISFRDNGIGFDQKYEQQIFTIFQRLNAQQKYTGTGIGLALCKKIMQNHDGFITAKSEFGYGAVFMVYFPVK